MHDCQEEYHLAYVYIPFFLLIVLSVRCLRKHDRWEHFICHCQTEVLTVIADMVECVCCLHSYMSSTVLAILVGLIWFINQMSHAHRAKACMRAMVVHLLIHTQLKVVSFTDGVIDSSESRGITKNIHAHKRQSWISLFDCWASNHNSIQAWTGCRNQSIVWQFGAFPTFSGTSAPKIHCFEKVWVEMEEFVCLSPTWCVFDAIRPLNIVQLWFMSACPDIFCALQDLIFRHFRESGKKIYHTRGDFVLLFSSSVMDMAQRSWKRCIGSSSFLS